MIIILETVIIIETAPKEIILSGEDLEKKKKKKKLNFPSRKRRHKLIVQWKFMKYLKGKRILTLVQVD